MALTRGIDTLIVIKRDKGSIFDILDMEENLIDGEIEARERVIEQRGVDGGVELISYGRQEISRREQVLNRDTIFGLAIHTVWRL